MEARLRTVIDTVVDGVILIDELGQVTVFNPACEQLFGYSEAEVLGRNIKSLMPSPYRDEHDHYLANYRRTRARRIIGIGREVVGQRKDGTTFPMELSVGEGRDEGATFFVGIIHDITARKRADSEREALIAELAASNEERGHFAHVASHDLQEPLRMISAFGALLQERYGQLLDERGHEYLTLVTDSALQMHKLVEDLLEYGRLSADGGHEAWFDTAASLKHVRDNLRETITASKALISAGSLPRLYGNEIRFMRLMQNLIANALHYVPRGTAPRVDILAEREGAGWRFDVRDNGIGIEAEHQERIFEPFKRLHTAESYKGTGLGLAICKKIVEGFGGRIWVRSAPGQGCTFSFTIKDAAESAP